MGVAIAALVLPAPSGLAQPLNIKISPANPQLGDTLSVVVESASAVPQISFQGKTYPMFPTSGAGQQNGRYRALLPTTPLNKPGSLSVQVSSGGNSATAQVNLRGRQFPTQSIWLPPGQDGNVTDYEYDRVDAFKALVTPDKLWSGPFLRPNNGPVTTGYGVRRYYNGEFAQDYFHRGVDYAGDHGSAVIAPAAGRVSLIGYEKDGYKVHGNVIGLDHGQGVVSLYLHLSRISVKPGQMVQAGQVIGALGNTGASTGPHLHWGLYVNGQSIDPVPWRNQTFE
jgi:murein DD-endopeptidase MepM/ murein hydrolase activator NlpD